MIEQKDLSSPRTDTSVGTISSVNDKRKKENGEK